MIKKSVLLDPVESVFGSHMELIQNETISVRSAADFRKKYPPATVEKLVEDHVLNCSICGQLPYPRVSIGHRQKQKNPLDGDSAVHDALWRIGAI